MKLKEKWNDLAAWQKVLIGIRDMALFAVLFSALPYIWMDFDNSFLILVCLPLSAIAQAALSWKKDRKTAIFFLFGAVFVFVMYMISMI